MKKILIAAFALALLAAGCDSPAGGGNNGGPDTYRAVKKDAVTYIPNYTFDNGTGEANAVVSSQLKDDLQNWVDGIPLNDYEDFRLFGMSGENKPPLEYFKSEHPGALFAPSLPADTADPASFASSAKVEVLQNAPGEGEEGLPGVSWGVWYVQMTAVIFEWEKK